MKKMIVPAITLALLSSVTLAFAQPPASGNMPNTGPSHQDQARPGGSEESPRARMGQAPSTSTSERQKLISATQVYRSIVKSGREVPRSVTDRARCVVVLPSEFSAALVVGGGRGTGIASCRTESGQWSQPVFLDRTSASVGAQVGAKSSDTVLFLMSPQAEEGLRKGRITLGVDASVVAGNYDRNWDSGASNIVAYQRSEGGMLGISLNGSTLSKNDTMNRNYYGREVNYEDLLRQRSQSGADKNIDAFISELPTART